MTKKDNCLTTTFRTVGNQLRRYRMQMHPTINNQKLRKAEKEKAKRAKESTEETKARGVDGDLG